MDIKKTKTTESLSKFESKEIKVKETEASEKNKLECEDQCLEEKDTQVCGKTDHL